MISTRGSGRYLDATSTDYSEMPAPFAFAIATRSCRIRSWAQCKRPSLVG